MSPMIGLGRWAPDRERVGSGVLFLALQSIARQSGYDYFPILNPSNSGSLASYCRGAFSGRSKSGTNFLVAGDVTQLKLNITGTLVNVSNGGGSPYTPGSNDWWEFVIFGDLLIATNHTNAMESYLIGTSAQFAALSADSPLARHIAVVRDFVVAGNIVGRGVNAPVIGTSENGVQWCAFNDPTAWPEVGTTAAQDVQSDWQPLQGEGGDITDVIGGSDFGLVFRRRAIWRMDYEGGDKIFRFSPISENIGCSVHKGAVRVGGKVYFPSEQGFYVTNGYDVDPIGNEEVDGFFRATYRPEKEHRVCSVHFPDLKCVLWTYMGLGSSGELVDSSIILSEADKMFSHGDGMGSEWLVNVPPFTTPLDNYTLAGVMDTGALAAVNLDSLIGSSSQRAGGFLNNSHALCTFVEEAFSSEFETSDFEINEGGVAVVKVIRPIFDTPPPSATVVVEGRMRPNGDPISVVGAPLDSTGAFRLMVSGRYHRARFSLFGRFKGFHGFDADTRPSGRR